LASTTENGIEQLRQSASVLEASEARLEWARSQVELGSALRRRRVARLAADGRSNPEIAQELFVSLKTVETHLSHTYGKLGLGGQGARGRLAAALASTSH
jgi:DNA-binding NarL/FixJ family response regulator